MRRIRILRVITRMNIGGPAIQAGLLTAMLDPARFETLLVAGAEGSREGNILSLGRLPSTVRPLLVPELGRRIAPADDLRALWKVTAIARAYRPDIVHTHLAKAGFVGRIAGRLAGAQAIVHTYHGSVFHGYFGRPESALYLGVERALAHVTSRIVAITPQGSEELARLRVAPAAKIVEIPLGLDLAPFRDAPDRLAARSLLGISPDEPLVGLVARLVPIKDVLTFLKAMALVIADIPQLAVMIVGDGEERARLEAAAVQIGLGTRCRFLGWRADLPVLYAAMDVLALSSINEGAPVSVIEAMATGRPVVATAVGGVPDVVLDGRTGFLVPPRDPKALSAAVSAILCDRQVADSFGKEGRRNALARFDAPRLVADIERLYASLAASDTRGPSENVARL